MKYDLIIVGAGPSGIFTALEYKKIHPKNRVLMIETGRSIKKRNCPERKDSKCVKCSPCNITAGFAGAGAWSDGKLSLDPMGNVGGTLINHVGVRDYENLLNYTDSIYLEFGVDKEVYGKTLSKEISKIKKNAISANLQLIDCPIRHMGTEKGHELYVKLQEHLQEKLGVEILFQTKVEDLIIEDEKIKGVITDNPIIESYGDSDTKVENSFHADKVVIAVGRSGSSWLSEIANKYKIKTKSLPVDIGVRIETRDEIMEEVNKNLYESKFVYYTPTFDDKVRVFCSNPSGMVSQELYENNLSVANGHAYKDSKTNNTNFALLVSRHFGDDFDTLSHGKKIAEISNELAGDNKILVQRYGDLLRGRRSTPERIMRGNIIPTLKEAVPGDLSSALPYRIMKDIMEMIEALDKVSPGFASDELLIYGIEVKFYSSKIDISDNCETKIKNLYAIGDGAGITRGLMQASMNGVYVARNI